MPEPFIVTVSAFIELLALIKQQHQRVGVFTQRCQTGLEFLSPKLGADERLRLCAPIFGDDHGVGPCFTHSLHLKLDLLINPIVQDVDLVQLQQQIHQVLIHSAQFPGDAEGESVDVADVPFVGMGSECPFCLRVKGGIGEIREGERFCVIEVLQDALDDFPLGCLVNPAPHVAPFVFTLPFPVADFASLALRILGISGAASIKSEGSNE